MTVTGTASPRPGLLLPGCREPRRDRHPQRQHRHTVSETGPRATRSTSAGFSSAGLAIGGTATSCTITNDDQAAT